MSNLRFSRSLRCTPRRTLVVAALLVVVPASGALAGISPVIIDNETIQLGVDTHGCLNVTGGSESAGDGTTTVGLRDGATNYESLAGGAPQEGWGIADLNSLNWAGASSAVGANDFVNLTLVDGGVSGSGTLTGSVGNSAFTVHEVGHNVVGPTAEGAPPPPLMRITHDFHPSTDSRLYEVTVTIENLSIFSIAPRYRRMLDWDVEPNTLSELVTLHQGPSTAVVHSAGNGFQSVDPFDPLTQSGGAAPTDARLRGICTTPPLDADFDDCGPGDLGAAFDFEFPEIPAGRALRFWLYYGAAPTEAGAYAALDAVGASAVSLGQSATNGTPVTFMFGFKAPWAILDNGTVELGVDLYGALNVHGGTVSSGGIVGPVREPTSPITGLRSVSTNYESLAFGTPREGWGVADLDSVTGGGTRSMVGGSKVIAPSNSIAPEGAGSDVAINMTPDDLVVLDTGTLTESVGRRAIVTDFVGDPPILKVTHDFRPSKSPNLYEVVVILKNLSGSAIAPRYRRIADWDIEPTPTNELVTIQYGGGSAVVASVDSGFNSPNPLDSMSGVLCTDNTPVVDCGAPFGADLGMGLDFEFGKLAAGGSEQFLLFYGAASDETAALAALTAVGAEAYSLGQSAPLAGPEIILTNPTFIFGFRDVLFVDDFETGDRTRWSTSVPL